MQKKEKKSLKSGTKFLENPKAVKIIIIAGVIGIALIFISSYFEADKGKLDESFDDTQKYGQSLELSLEEIVRKIQGVGEVDILLTMENSSENVYLSEKDTKTKEIQPKVRGVVVVCDGAEDPVVCGRVMSAVTKALDITSTKVCITKLTQ